MISEKLKFEVLKLVVENGSEVDKRNPIPRADEWLKWLSVKEEVKKSPGRPRKK